MYPKQTANPHNPETINIAIVGAGLMGYWHSRFALKAGATIIAIVDTNLGLANTLALKMPNCKAYTDLNAMLRVHKPDVIHICTPLNTHFDLAKIAIENSIHILIEKPLAQSSAQVTQLVRLAQAKNVLLCPIHQFCFQQGVQQTLEALKTSGKPLRIDFNIASAGANNQLEHKLNDILLEILPHPLSILRHLWPDQSFDCKDWIIKQHNKGELLILGHYNDIVLTLCISLLARPTRCELSIQTTTETLHVNLFHDYMVKEIGTVSRIRKILQPLILSFKSFYFCTLNLFRRTITGQSAYPGLLELISRFYRSVMLHTDIPISTADTISIANARDEITEMMKG